jgi:hypothetical protein
MSDYQAGEYTFNGKVYSLTAAQMQAMAVLTMPQLETRFHGFAVTGRYTSRPIWYQGRFGVHAASQHPKIHHATARALRDRGLATVELDMGLQEFLVRPVKEES